MLNLELSGWMKKYCNVLLAFSFFAPFIIWLKLKLHATFHALPATTHLPADQHFLITLGKNAHPFFTDYLTGIPIANIQLMFAENI